MGCSPRSAWLTSGHARVRGAEARRLLLHVVDQLRALNAVGPAGKVLDQGGDGELAAGFVAFEDQRLQVGARGVDGSGKSGAAGAEDDGVANFCHELSRVDFSWKGLGQVHPWCL